MNNPALSSDSLIQPVANCGILPEWEDKVLCRSGEELLLEPMPDRFTVALYSALHYSVLHSEASVTPIVAQIAASLDAEVLQYVPSVALVELQVAPDRLEESMQKARQLEQVRLVSPVYWMKHRMQQGRGTPIYLTNQLTVQFAETTDANAMRTIARTLGLRVVKLVPGIAKAFVFETMQQAEANPLKLAHQLMRYPQVLMAEPNGVVPIKHDDSAADFAQTLEGDKLFHSVQKDVEAVWNLTQGDRSIAIAVAERAIDWLHLDRVGLGKVVAPLELGGERQKVEGGGQEIETEAQPDVECQKSSSAIPTLMAVAPDCALMPIEIGDWLDDQLIEQMCEWAIEQGASVLVCSWRSDAVYFPLSLRQRAALSRLATQGRGGKGCVVIFAWGDNEHSSEKNKTAQDSDNGSEQDKLSEQTEYLNGFAVHPDVMTVAASPDRFAVNNFGNLNLSVCAASENGAGGASAMVAGIAALMLSVNPDLTARAVKQILQDTADRILPAETESASLHSTYNASGHSPRFGYGQVNAFKAVQSALHSIKPIEIPDRWIELVNATPLAIPDGDLPGGCSAIEVADLNLTIKSIEIYVEIEHSLMGDVEIYLISPRGETVLLQNRTLGRITMLRKTYNLETTPFLKTLLNQPATGQWQLKVIDRVVLNTGELKQWQLKLGVRKG